jgi:hypothetical protein
MMVGDKFIKFSTAELASPGLAQTVLARKFYEFISNLQVIFVKKEKQD